MFQVMGQTGKYCQCDEIHYNLLNWKKSQRLKMTIKLPKASIVLSKLIVPNRETLAGKFDIVTQEVESETNISVVDILMFNDSSYPATTR